MSPLGSRFANQFKNSISSKTFSPSPADFSPPLDRRTLDPWVSEVTGHGLYDDGYPSSPSLAPLLPPQAYLSLEGQNGEEAGEENIVYL